MNDSTSKTLLTEKVIGLISSLMIVPLDNITASSSLEELGIDSLGGLTIVGEMEDVFDVVIPNEKALQITTVCQAIECLQEALAKRDNGDPL